MPLLHLMCMRAFRCRRSLFCCTLDPVGTRVLVPVIMMYVPSSMRCEAFYACGFLHDKIMNIGGMGTDALLLDEHSTTRSCSRGIHTLGCEYARDGSHAEFEACL